MAKGVCVFPEIAAAMARHNDTITVLSKEIGIGSAALSMRLAGKRSFELPEIIGIMRRYNQSFEVLFQQQPPASA